MYLNNLNQEEKTMCYVEWDNTKKTNNPNLKTRIKTIIEKLECRKNADILEYYDQIYPNSKKNNQNLSEANLSKILKNIPNLARDQNGKIIRNTNGLMYFVEDENELFLDEMINLFNEGNGISYNLKYYTTILDEEYALKFITDIKNKYGKRIMEFNIQYIDNKAKINIAYRTPFKKLPLTFTNENGQDFLECDTDVKTINKLFGRVTTYKPYLKK